ncbi:protein of unknown function [Rhodovastum atsumiense]|nr:protein of unknown function [Rhodovastum atsumiense]
MFMFIRMPDVRQSYDDCSIIYWMRRFRSDKQKIFFGFS